MLAISQRYLLLGTDLKSNNKVKLSLLFAGLVDLKNNHVITIDSEEQLILFEKKLPNTFDYLESIFKLIKRKKLIRLTKLTKVFLYDKKILEKLVYDMENSIKLIADLPDIKNEVVEEIKKEVSENHIKKETVYLLILLNKTKQLKQYFSKKEIFKINQKLNIFPLENEIKCLTNIIEKTNALNIVLVLSLLL